MPYIAGRLLKITLAIIAFILLCALALALFLLSSNANFLKPKLEKALAERGVFTEILGDLNWSVYPVAGVKSGEIQLFPSAARVDTEKLASIDSFNLQLDLLALIRERELRINAVFVQHPKVDFHIGENGESNWQPVLDAFARDSDTNTDTDTEGGEPAKRAPAEPEKASDNSNASDTQIAIERIKISDFELSYTSAVNNSNIKLRQTDVQLDAVNLNGQPMQIALNSELTFASYPPIRIGFESTITQTGAGEITFASTRLSAMATEEADAHINGNISVVTSPALKAEATIQLDELNPAAWLKWMEVALPEMSNSSALTKFAANANIQYRGDQLEVAVLSATLDKTKLDAKGTVSLQPELPPKLQLTLAVDQLNLDHYLPPVPQPDESTPTPPVNAAPESADNSPLNLDALNSISGVINLRAQKVTFLEQNLTNLDSDLTLKPGVTTVTVKNGSLYEGTLSGTAKLKHANTNNQLTSEFSMSGLDVGLALSSLGLYDQLKGTMNIQINGETQGGSAAALTEGFSAHLTAQSELMKFEAVNLEQVYCDAISKLDNSRTDKTWEPYTSISALTANIDYTSAGITINSLAARVQGIQTDAMGTFNPTTKNFVIPANLAFADFTAAQKSCPLLNAKWRSQRIPVICEGSLDTIGKDVCKLDFKRLSDKWEDKFKTETKKASDKVEERYKESREDAKDKVDERAKDLLENLVGEEKSKELGDKLEDGFKNLLKRKKSEK